MSSSFCFKLFLRLFTFLVLASKSDLFQLRAIDDSDHSYAVNESSLAAVIAVRSSATPPAIDVSILFKDRNHVAHSDALALSQLRQQLEAAIRDWGFFNIVNHSIPATLIDSLNHEMNLFFGADVHVKRAISRGLNNSRGFTDAEYTKQKLDLKEIFDVGHKPNPQLADDDASNHVLDGFNQWPDPTVLPTFRPVVESYYLACTSLARTLLGVMVASVVDVGSESIDAHFINHTSFLRLNYYPAPLQKDNGTFTLDGTADVLVSHSGELVDGHRHGGLGISRHTDAGVLTILLQGRDVSGLEVYSGTKEDAGDGEWLPVDPVDGALTINVGDMFQVWTNGEVSAPEHRVRASKPHRPRFSAPFFFNPSYETIIAPLDANDGSNARYRPINWGYFRSQRFLGDFADFGKEIQIEDFLIRSPN